MKSAFFTVLAVALSASPAAADWAYENSFASFAIPSPITGTMRLAIQSEGSEPFEWQYPALTPIPQFGGERYVTILEGDAAAHGLDWDGLETILQGPEAKSVEFGPLGLELTTPYVRELPGEWITDLTMTEVEFYYRAARQSILEPMRWQATSVRVSGNFTIVAPEPASWFGLCFGLAHVTLAGRGRRFRCC